MKKFRILTAFLMFGLIVSAPAAFAAPTVDGFVSPSSEWANAGYSYYLSLSDPNEADNKFDNMDISSVVLLQELGGDASDDGVYLLIDVHSRPVSLEDPLDSPDSPPTPTAIPVVNMSGDFEGDGTYDIHLRHFNTNAADGVENPAQDAVQVCLGDSSACHPLLGTWIPLSAGGGIFQRGDVLEYYLPVGSFGTPNAPFPQDFKGVITFDNGASGLNTSDDIVVGQRPEGPGGEIIPEPATLMLVGSSLLGLLGMGKLNRK